MRIKSLIALPFVYILLRNMNFLSHFYLDRQHTNEYFIAGVCSPDLLSIFSRELKIKHDFEQSQLQKEAVPFYEGVHRHYAVDKIFHSCDFFKEETDAISQFLYTLFKKDEVHRVFFVAHVLLELMIDKILIEQDDDLVPNFYVHLENVGAVNLAKITQEFIQKPIIGYDAFLQRFIQNRYLVHYNKYDYIIFVLKQIVGRVGIKETLYMDSPIFLNFLVAYQKELLPKVENLFVFLHRKLDKME